MPDRDWWLRLCGALALAPFSIIWPVSYLSAQLPLDAALGHSPTRDIILAVLLGSGVLLLVMTLAVQSARHLGRFRRRRVAIQGDLSALPFRFLMPYSAEVTDIGGVPLELIWLSRVAEHPRLARARVIWGLVVVVLALAMGLGLSVLLFSAPHKESTFYYLTAAFPTTYIGLGRAYRVCARGIAQTFGAPKRMLANDDGVTWVPILGRTRVMRWHEMALLEISGDASSHCYVLYSHEQALPWSSDFIYLHADHRFYAMLDLIRARTALVPYTFDKKLASASSDTGTVESPLFASESDVVQNDVVQNDVVQVEDRPH